MLRRPSARTACPQRTLSAPWRPAAGGPTVRSFAPPVAAGGAAAAATALPRAVTGRCRHRCPRRAGGDSGPRSRPDRAGTDGMHRTSGAASPAAMTTASSFERAPSAAMASVNWSRTTSMGSPSHPATSPVVSPVAASWSVRSAAGGTAPTKRPSPFGDRAASVHRGAPASGRQSWKLHIFAAAWTCTPRQSAHSGPARRSRPAPSRPYVDTRHGRSHRYLPPRPERPPGGCDPGR